jgi:radical SAM superfamily enzyme YgiQ (UPF0313 family)
VTGVQTCALPISYLKKLIDSGLDVIHFGIQAGSDHILNQVFHRPGRTHEIIALAQEIAKHRVKIKYDLILDNPYDTEQSLKETVLLLMELPKPLLFNLYSLQFYPGYPLTKKAIDDKLISDEEENIENLFERNMRSWAFVPKGLPNTKKHQWQNVIWLIAWNHANYDLVKFALQSDKRGAGLVLWYLNRRSIILGKLVGVGGFFWRNAWIGKIGKGIMYIFKGDIQTLYLKAKSNIERFNKLDFR